RVDFGSFTMPESVPDSGGLLRSESPGNRTEVLLFNSQVLDEEVRDSLAENIDRSRVSSGAGFRPTDAVFPGANPPSDEAVWSADQNGESVSTESPLRLVYPAGGPARDAAARSVVEQLEAADVEVESERVEPKEFFAETFPSGDFDLAIMDFASPAEYAALSPFLPDDSAFAVSASLGEMDEREQYFAQTRRIMAAESALLPLYAWPDAYSWSSTLSGPQPETPRRATLWNIREWGFFK
ncbi:MAG: hypothetical protein ACRDSJ_15930, partial [Rubrobacteraceae bacterium]